MSTLVAESFRSAEEQFEAGADFDVLSACQSKTTFKDIFRGVSSE